ncbi:flagellar protein FlgN [Mameliella sediminis]|uniref:flagellar protein FlgN n=1 Tax=Mameliella sediminis TaxID=2836866 RepID=UPI001C449E5E|nr:flagellar protein FlgN [Mameliella sediminis]MBY6114058.1 flagellar protein FlgN [Antarctobacter heliothermus]MBY6142594.1 flagellar protein FlgN [Mameliella alba]MBV7395355.1 flagellar protein FlgN [Mameliella sediminis]MBY6159449.1 flagellar protein FlgN [Mameliella alba]MBY6167920.1 flagellar protein FlgN [Mameliella alba]
MTEQPITKRLTILLEAERAALLAGDFDRLADLMEEKQSLAEDLADRSLDAEEVAPIRDGLRRNQELFDQAMAGLRNVAARIGDLNRVRRATDTYDASGRRQTIGTSGANRLERRA